MSGAEPALRETARDALCAKLLEARNAQGVWEGSLSSSALSTATALSAMAMARRAGVPGIKERSLHAAAGWLAAHQNDDGGFGDTCASPSNLSTTVLAWVALGVDPELASLHAGCLARIDGYLHEHVGPLTPESLSAAIEEVYGEDRTFAIPILVNCALGGRFGEGPAAWRTIRPLPFELAALPRGLFPALGLPVVSYALPALIAVGQVIHAAGARRNPLTSLTRGLSRSRTLDVLRAIQPASGGFLEATPLTSFVVMSLVGCGQAGHTVVAEGLRFLQDSERPDGSWPIDSNLATWVTTLAVNALDAGGRLKQLVTPDERVRMAEWIAAQQFDEVHPYTRAAPGGWAWTDLSGGVPDADDTSGALLALRALAAGDDGKAAEAGCGWLAGLQNRDGGIPTFCRGWGKLPFDRSCPDLSAHALRAWSAWATELSDERVTVRLRAARLRAAAHLVRSQASDGSWTPLWFGNQQHERQENPLYGTSRVVRAGAAGEGPVWSAAIERGADWMVGIQHADGGFGADVGVAASFEETALAVEALAGCASQGARAAAARGAGWLARACADGALPEPSPIGLYFAKLWYSEELYPLVFGVAALERAQGE